MPNHDKPPNQPAITAEDLAKIDPASREIFLRFLTELAQEYRDEAHNYALGDNKWAENAMSSARRALNGAITRLGGERVMGWGGYD